MAAELNRQRAELTDVNMEEKLEVQAAFREHAARLQVHYEIL